MTKKERNNWLMNIESVAVEVAANIGQETVDFVLSKYGAKNVYALKSPTFQKYSANYMQSHPTTEYLVLSMTINCSITSQLPDAASS